MNKFYVFGKLYARPSFLEGVARNIDILNTLQEYNDSASEREADAKALQNDWRAVGDDLRQAMSTYERGQRKS